ncbi:hypothetical protein GBA65_10730 [Rubrobacter marinus]|uniref:FtsK domain-containing protein n=1 Tax=Rubrobacter marinus TaxID=2653852 RepID=A0A6G8PXK3_9ACTN|nr:DNA translocase FtsK [Rubrobacter marinus]QIN78920.1 hypothetical protein GBA65_10730 [Rubrobacter marinus]
MATNRSPRRHSTRASTKAAGKGSSKASNSKKRSSAKGGGSGPFSRLGEVLSREAIGLVLLVAGIFFTASFVTGRGAVLGEAGLLAATRTLGVVGLALAPLAVLAGALLLLGRFPGRRAAGLALLLVSIAATLAATLPPQTRFDEAVYPDRGGLVGSGIYGALAVAGGPVGAALALLALYAAGVFLLTGLSPRDSAAGASARAGSAASTLREKLRDARERRRQQGAQKVRQASPKRARPAQEELRGVHGGPSESEAPGALPEDAGAPPLQPAARVFDYEGGPEGSTEDEPEEPFEIVLPEFREEAGLDEEGPVIPGEYSLPPLSLLRPGRGDPEHDAEGTSRRLTRALADLGVEATVVRAVVGPRVTRYELRLGSGVKVGKVRNLQQDIAYALAATEVRILAPIPGKSAVGVEVPNTRPAVVTLGDVFREYPAGNDWSLPVALGKDISGRAVFFDMAEMPHLLVAGTTGSGKSVMLNGLLTSLLLTTDPRQVKMVLIDPKRVELSQFARVPHLITPVVTDVKKAANALSWAVAEMERRYEVLEKFGVRSLDGYNEKRPEKQMPYVVVVIDELADLMMTSAAKVEDAVIRLAQKARAVGIHLVVATQRPSVDVITGMIKANVPSRIAFAVSSQVDSRVILDTPGAEALLGQGDMLFKPVSALRPSRVQGAYLSEAEVDEVVTACAERAQARFVEEVTETRGEKEESGEPEDELLPDAASFVVATQQASVSAVQRRFRVGYSRAGRIVDALERKGVVGPHEGSKSRSVIVTELELPRIFDPEGSGDGTNPGGPDGRAGGVDGDEGAFPFGRFDEERGTGGGDPYGAPRDRE